MNISYRVSTDFPKGCLFRHIKGDETEAYQQWSVIRRTWVDSESACGAFVGFEPSCEISAQEAEAIIKQSREVFNG